MPIFLRLESLEPQGLGIMKLTQFTAILKLFIFNLVTSLSVNCIFTKNMTAMPVMEGKAVIY